MPLFRLAGKLNGRALCQLAEGSCFYDLSEVFCRGMKNHKSIFFLLLLAGCASDPKPPTADVPAPQENKPVIQENKNDTDSTVVMKDVFKPQNNADTVLARFLFKNYKNFDPNAQFLEYMQWDLNHEKIKPLLVKLYLKGQDKHPVLDILEQNRQAFHDKAVTAVLDEYRATGNFFGVWFAYLVKRNDESLVPLLQDLLNNPKASGKDKEYALSVLRNLKVKE